MRAITLALLLLSAEIAFAQEPTPVASEEEPKPTPTATAVEATPTPMATETPAADPATPAISVERRRLRAARASGSIEIDGALSESAWSEAPVATDFLQIDPKTGAPSEFPTEVRVLFDGDQLYIGVKCFDPAGARGLRVPDLRRDFDIWLHDHFGVAIDAFGDGRVGIGFSVNPWGAQADRQVFEDLLWDINWDALWRTKTRRGDDGWTAEIAIPWSSLRYPKDATEWRVNFTRMVKRVNETSGWNPWPRFNSVHRMTFAGVLEGLEPPRPSLNLQVTPYAAGRATRHQEQLLSDDDETEPRVGIDAKWAPETNTVVDLTVNTDFAQADVDRFIVNLSRFNVFFPEKRQFFLESASLFSVGYLNTFYPFFSRRIGLSPFGEPIPIDGGVRVVRRTPDRSFGALALHTREDEKAGVPGSVFAVARGTENFGEANRVGGMLVFRGDEKLDGSPATANVVPAADVFLRFGPTFIVESTLTGSFTDGTGGDGLAGVVDVYNRAPWGVVGIANIFIDRNYVARTGFVRIPGANLVNPYADLDLRPKWKPKFIRSFNSFSFGELYYAQPDGDLIDGYVRLAPLGANFESGEYFRAYVTPQWQVLDAPFEPLPGVTYSPGRYRTYSWGGEAGTDPSRKLGARVEVQAGRFYDGTLDYTAGIVFARPLPHVAFQGVWQRFEAANDGVRERDDLIAPEVRLALSPQTQLVVFWQKSTAANREAWFARFSWEFRPLSNLYVVYTDTHVKPDAPEPWTRDRQLVVKLTYLWQL